MSGNTMEALTGAGALDRTGLVTYIDREREMEALIEIPSAEVSRILEKTDPSVSPPVIVESTPDRLGVTDINNDAVRVTYALFQEDGTPIRNDSGRFTGTFIGLHSYTTYVIKSFVERLNPVTKELETITTQAIFTTMPDDFRYREAPRFLTKEPSSLGN